jgi:hypothetical protein
VQTPDGESHYEWSSIPYDATINPEEIAKQDEQKRMRKGFLIRKLLRGL